MTRSEGKEQKQKKTKQANKKTQQKKRHSQQCSELEIEVYRTVPNWQLQFWQLSSNSASQILGLSNLWQTHHFPYRPLPLINLLTPGNGVWERHVLCLECQLRQIVGWNTSSWHQSSPIPCSAMLALLCFDHCICSPGKLPALRQVHHCNIHFWKEKTQSPTNH